MQLQKDNVVLRRKNAQNFNISKFKSDYRFILKIINCYFNKHMGFAVKIFFFVTGIPTITMIAITSHVV